MDPNFMVYEIIPILSGKYFIPDIYSKQPGALLSLLMWYKVGPYKL